MAIQFGKNMTKINVERINSWSNCCCRCRCCC
jgi:hypothetical protein